MKKLAIIPLLASLAASSAFADIPALADLPPIDDTTTASATVYNCAVTLVHHNDGKDLRLDAHYESGMRLYDFGDFIWTQSGKTFVYYAPFVKVDNGTLYAEAANIPGNSAVLDRAIMQLGVGNDNTPHSFMSLSKCRVERAKLED